MKFFSVILCIVASGLCGAESEPSPAPGTASEQQPEKSTATKPGEESEAWWNGKYALTDWNGIRTDLAKRGIFFELRYIGELRDNAAGGLSTDSPPKYLGNLNLSFDLFTDKFGLYDGGEFYVRFENDHGQGISTHLVGDVQRLSYIDAPAFSMISELFYRHSILDNRLHFKIGKQDGTGDFIALKYGADFTHSAYGCISNVPLPRFFVYAPAAVVTFDATKWMTFGTGVYDGNFDRHILGLAHPFTHPFREFSIAELDLKPELIEKQPTIIRLGAWHQRINLPLQGAVNPDGSPDLTTRFRHNGGAYCEFEQLVYRTPEKKAEAEAEKKEPDLVAPGGPEKPENGLACFAQISYSPDDRNDQPRYFGGGLFYKGTFKGRDDDSVGAGVVDVNFSKRLRGEGKTHEAAIESFYKVQTTPFSFFQPDFQYIVRPAGHLRNATTVGFRFQIEF
jgi:porin